MIERERGEKRRNSMNVTPEEDEKSKRNKNNKEKDDIAIDMARVKRTIFCHGLNKGFNLKLQGYLLIISSLARKIKTTRMQGITGLVRKRGDNEDQD